MNSIKKTVDLNAHIENLNCVIDSDSKIAIATVRFNNLGFGDITAIKFTAIGFDSFGDKVMINGSEEFVFQFQDIFVKKFASSGDLTISLPAENIRKVHLTENKICFANGTVLDYDGSCEKNIEYERFDSSNATERDQIAALNHYENKNFACKPKEFDFGWLCGCEFINTLGSTECAKCSMNKKRAFSSCEDKYLNDLVEKHKKDCREKKRITKIKVFLIALCALIVSFIIFVAIDSSVISSRATFSSESRMESVLQGVWVYMPSITGNALHAMEIQGDTVILYEYYDRAGTTEKIRFFPDRGCFFINGKKYIVKKEKDLFVLYFKKDQKYTPGALYYLGRDPETEEYKADLDIATKEAKTFCNKMEDDHSEIYYIYLHDIVKYEQGSFVFSADIFYENGDVRTLHIYVEKDDTGDFNVSAYYK